MIKALVTAAILAASAATVASAASVKFNTDGVLTGVSGLNVNGRLFDVVFEDGSCDSLYDGCDDAAITFGDEGEALDAITALYFAAIFGTPVDADPSLTAFCENTSSNCLTRVAFDNGDPTTSAQGVLVNFPANGLDFPFFETLTADNDSRDFSNVNFATFTPTPIPLPAAGWMLVTGLAGLIGMKRRSRKRAGRISGE